MFKKKKKFILILRIWSYVIEKKNDMILKRERACEKKKKKKKKKLIFQILSQLRLHKYSTTTQIFSHLPFSLSLKKKKKIPITKFKI
jgi:hypothetical protein